MNDSAKQRILVTVKTYPTISRRYGETVCTAGIREDGSWLRLYPVPFRRLEDGEQYKKFDWIECRLARTSGDPRPESYRPLEQSELVPVGHIGTDDQWRERRFLLLKRAHVFNRLDDIITGAKENRMSLAVFKPTRVSEFIVEKEDDQWDPEKVRQMREMHSQLDLFSDNEWRKTFQLIPKLPYSFSYRFEDDTGKSSEMQILDWEAGALYWNCFRNAGGDSETALQKVREKYFDAFLKTDLHFFLGTTQQFHFVAPNPWVIVGVFPIPYERQPDLFS